MSEGELVPRQEPRTEAATLMTVISTAAANPQVDVEKLERLLIMYERIRRDTAAAEFSAAMAEMQNELPEVLEHGKIKVGSEIRSTYALFEDINDACKPILKRHGFAMSFRISIDEAKISVTGVLSHRSGHSESTSIVLPSDVSGSKNSVQAIGSSVSYGKRYVMSALLNITTRGEDDDGRSGGTKFISEKQLSTLRDMLTAANRLEADVAKWAKVASFEELPERDYGKVFAALKQAAQVKK